MANWSKENLVKGGGMVVDRASPNNDASGW
jgi:hypothetical protein